MPLQLGRSKSCLCQCQSHSHTGHSSDSFQENEVLPSLFRNHAEQQVQVVKGKFIYKDVFYVDSRPWSKQVRTKDIKCQAGRGRSHTPRSECLFLTTLLGIQHPAKHTQGGGR